MYTFPAHLWPPQLSGLQQTISLLEQGKSVCLQAPTGGGKTACSVELFNWALDKGWKCSFLLNRRLLIQQTADVFTKARLPFGIRAAGFDDQYDFSAPLQLCSTDTEWARCYNSKVWQQPESQLVVVDELHIQKAEKMQTILADARLSGAVVVGLTATPIGVSNIVDELVVSGSLREYRECGAIVMAEVKSISQPDVSKVQRNATGEFILDGEKKRIFTQHIVADVLDRWKKYNPDAKPTLLYAPDVASSIWFCDRFRNLGVNCAHVDATECVVDGLRERLSRSMWTEISERFIDGDIKVICSRFKLREGVNFPSVYHCILATPIGSLASYVQTIGRVLRHSPETPDRVMVTCHGGNYWRFGSPNADQPWHELWTLPEHVASEFHEREIKERKKPEPIRCPNCETERPTGIRCPICGFEHPKSSRRVIMEDGTMETVDGPMMKPKYVSKKSDTERLWAKMYHSWMNSKRVNKHGKRCRDKSFSQLEGFFAHTHHYHPPRDLPLMPKLKQDWYLPIVSVPREHLYGSAT